MTNTLDRRFPQEDAASIIFGTAEPTADQIGRVFTLARALGANPDAWSLADLRAAHVLAALAGDNYSRSNLEHYLETARSFSYPLRDGDRIVVVRLGSFVVSATLVDVEAIRDFVDRLSINYAALAPRTAQAHLSVTAIAPSPDVEYHALEEAA